MEKRIELEKRGRPMEQVVELNLDNCRATQVTGLTDQFAKLKVLSLINVGLTTLKGFPSLPSLKRLELSDNRISNGLNQLHGCPSLTTINLSGNKIKDLETLEPLKGLPELRTLDLFNCEVTNLDNYREAIFDMLKGLKYLDGFDVDNEEAVEDEWEGEDDVGGASDDDGEDSLEDVGSDDDDDLDEDDVSDDDENEFGGEEDEADITGLDESRPAADDDDSLDDEDDLDNDDDLDDDDLDDEDDEEVSDANGEAHANGDDATDDDDEEEEQEGGTQHGTKRKHEDDEEDGD